MSGKKYSKTFRTRVVREALKPEFEGKEFLVAEKYNLRPSTVWRWKDLYEQYGEMGLSNHIEQFREANSKLKSTDQQIQSAKDREIAELKEEVEILKKAAAFLAKMPRD